MAEIQQGEVVEITTDFKFIVRPFGSGGAVTPPLQTQEVYVTLGGLETYALHPDVVVGDTVAYALFDDGWGILLAKRQEGYMNGYIPSPVGE